MDSFDVSRIKIEKANAILRYRRLQRITTLFRFIELCVVLIMISRFSTQLPVAFKLSGEYFRGLFVSLISPRFVFVLGNLIVIILFMKSGQFSSRDDTGNKSCIDIYNEYVLNSEKNRNIHREESESKEEDGTIVANKKIYRSQSENLKRQQHPEKARRELRRWATERCRKSVNCCSKDEMSNEEFRRTVEDFIARQQRFLREEEFSPIVSFET
uniref:DUF4408 domain-containing protein n=1 Tax=Davidia involucrata TaxID=16924 RepID=A0A5B7CAB0_DAVIN